MASLGWKGLKVEFIIIKWIKIKNELTKLNNGVTNMKTLIS
jgi:hypothetical protein